MLVLLPVQRFFCVELQVVEVLQAEHVEDPAAAQFPAAHALHTLPADADNFPAAHDWHSCTRITTMPEPPEPPI